MYGDLSIFTGNAHPATRRRRCATISKSNSARPKSSSSATRNLRQDQRERAREGRLRHPADCRPSTTAIMELLIMLDALQARIGWAHHSGHPVFRLRPHRQEGPAARADHGAAAGRYDPDGRRGPRADHGSARGPDTGLLQHPGRRADRGRRCCATICAGFDLHGPGRGLVGHRVSPSARATSPSMLDAPLAIVEKRRIGNDGRSESTVAHRRRAGKTRSIVDDEIDRRQLAHRARSRCVGAGRRGRCYGCCIHAVLSGPGRGAAARRRT